MRFRLLFTAVLAGGMLATATAAASTVRVNDDGIAVFRSGPAASDLEIDFGVADGAFASWFADALQPLTAGPGCFPFQPPTVQCASDRVHVRLQDGDDRVDASRYVGLGAVAVWADGGDDDVRLNTLGGGAGYPVNGGAGGDTIQVNTSSPHLTGGPGADHLYAIGSGAADVAGGAGADLIVNTNANALIRGGDGADGFLLRGVGTAYGDAGRDTMILTGSGGFAADGGAGADTIVGGDRPDTVSAAEGDDTVDVSAGGADTVDCGPDHDTVFADPEDVVTNCEHVLAGPMPPNADVAAVIAHAQDTFDLWWLD